MVLNMDSPHFEKAGTQLSLAKITVSVITSTKSTNETCHEIFQKLLLDLRRNTGEGFGCVSVTDI